MEAVGFVNLYLLGPQNLLFPSVLVNILSFCYVPNVLSQENSIAMVMPRMTILKLLSDIQASKCFIMLMQKIEFS
jgi:hypothetical protein